MAVLCFGGLAASLMQTLVIPIQSELPRLLDTTPTNASWVITATLLAGAVTMPVAGRLADIFGKQRMLSASAAILLVGAVVAAMADSLGPMLVGRVLQGMAMGYMPVAISLVREVVPPRVAPIGIASISATMGLGGSFAIPAAAFVVENYDFHWLFWGSAALAAVSLLASLFLLPHLEDGRPARLDLAGIVGLAVGLSGVLVGVSKGKDWHWDSPATWGSILGGLAVLLAWGWHELRTVEPLVDLRTSARRPVLLTNLAGVLIGFGMMANSIVIPQLLTISKDSGYGLGQSLLEGGLWMAPGGVVMLCMAPVSGRLINRIGARSTLTIAAVTIGCAYLVGLFLMSHPWELMISMMLCSAGVGIGFAAMPTLILDNVPMSEAGASVGLNGLMRSVGTTVAGAVMAALLSSQIHVFFDADLDAMSGASAEFTFRLCFLVGAAAAFVGALITLFIPARSPAPAPVPEEALAA